MKTLTRRDGVLLPPVRVGHSTRLSLAVGEPKGSLMASHLRGEFASKRSTNQKPDVD